MSAKVERLWAAALDADKAWDEAGKRAHDSMDALVWARQEVDDALEALRLSEGKAERAEARAEYKATVKALKRSKREAIKAHREVIAAAERASRAWRQVAADPSATRKHRRDAEARADYAARAAEGWKAALEEISKPEEEGEDG